ncbi:MAG: nitroreductase family protein [Clostridia bacterium]|nr:nitroreductase family protein [Clostridia bacterium]
MNFSELATSRYSVRAFRDTPIEQDKLLSILEAGHVAPTARNFQPQKIYVIKSEEYRARLASVCRFTFGAPVILAVGYDTERAWKNKLANGHSSGETDAAIVCTHMMLKAWELGIGSCWVGWYDPKAVSEALGLPDNVVLCSLLPLGYPAEDAAPAALHTQYRALDDVVTEL